MYKISKQANEYVVSNKQGIIIAYFDSKAMAQDYVVAQTRADEQSKVMQAYNLQQLNKELFAEFVAEFA